MRATSRNAFKELGEVLNPQYRFNNDHVKPMEVRVRSLRYPFDPSPPSSSIHLGPIGEPTSDNDVVSNLEGELPVTAAILGGAVMFFFLLIIGFCWRWRSKKTKRKRRKTTPDEYGVKSKFRGLSVLNEIFSSQHHFSAPNGNLL